MSSKHRFTFNEEYQRRCEGSPLKAETAEGCNTRGDDWVAAGTATASPEANPNYFGNTPYHVTQGLWTAPMTNRLLLEAGFTCFSFKGGTTGRSPPDGIFDLISVTEQSTAINPVTGLQYAPRANYRLSRSRDRQPQLREPEQLARLGVVRHRVARSEGRLSGRVHHRRLVVPDSRLQVSYRFNLGVPNQFTFRLPEWHTGGPHVDGGALRPGPVDARAADAAGRAALRPRLELQPGGIQRDDRPRSSTRRRLRSSGRLGVDAFNDITPRFGAAWDVFGNGKTALKFNLGHYLDAATNDSEYTSNSPAVRIVRTGRPQLGGQQ